MFTTVLVARTPDIFNKTLGHMPVLFVATKPDIFGETSRHFPVVISGDVETFFSLNSCIFFELSSVYL